MIHSPIDRRSTLAMIRNLTKGLSPRRFRLSAGLFLICSKSAFRYFNDGVTKVPGIADDTGANFRSLDGTNVEHVFYEIFYFFLFFSASC